MYIVRFYEDFVENGELILIMDYCEGICKRMQERIWNF